VPRPGAAGASQWLPPTIPLCLDAPVQAGLACVRALRNCGAAHSNLNSRTDPIAGPVPAGPAQSRSWRSRRGQNTGIPSRAQRACASNSDNSLTTVSGASFAPRSTLFTSVATRNGCASSVGAGRLAAVGSG